MVFPQKIHRNKKMGLHVVKVPDYNIIILPVWFPIFPFVACILPFLTFVPPQRVDVNGDFVSKEYPYVVLVTQVKQLQSYSNGHTVPGWCRRWLQW